MAVGSKGERKTVDDKNASEEFAHKKKLWIYTSVDPVAFSFVYL